MKISFTLILFLLSALSIGQEFPAIDWGRVGVVESYELNIPTIDFSEVKSSFSADVTDDIVIQHIFKESDGGAIIYFPKGEYHFKKQIKLPSGFVLKGEDLTAMLIFDLEKDQDCIAATGTFKKGEYSVDAELGKGFSELITKDNGNFQAGEYVYLFDDDEDLVKSDWAKGKTGQLIQIKRITETGFEFYGQLRRDYYMANNPRLKKVELVKWVGIERLSIVNNTKTEWQSSNIRFTLVENSWIGGVSSRFCNYSHVLLEYAVNCEVMGGNFEDAHDFGNGGKAYGITLQFATSDCLIMGNNLENLRHALMIQAGANGNVLARNTSEDPYWTDVRLPSDAAGDIVLHGNYPYANLIEDNSCEHIVVDNSHGKNGPDNFFFKNVVDGYGIYIHRKSKEQYVMYNTVMPNPFPRGRFRVRGKQYAYHNKVGLKFKKSLKRDDCFKKSYWY